MHAQLSQHFSSKAQVKRFPGLQLGARAWVIAQALDNSHQTLVVCKDRKGAEELLQDLHFFNGTTGKILLYPSWDTLPFEPLSPQVDNMGARLRALQALGAGERCVIVAEVNALLQRVWSREQLLARVATISVGEQVGRDLLLSQLVSLGFRRVTLVEEPGELAVRGAVLDFFPPGSAFPIRLEFLAGRVESIKYFEAESQRSVQPLERTQILPVREFFWPATPEAQDAAVQRLRERAAQLEVPLREVNRVADALRSATDIPGIEQLLPLVEPSLVSMLEYLSPETQILLDDHIDLDRSLLDYQELVTERANRLRSEHLLFPEPSQLYLEVETLRSTLSARPHIAFERLELLQADESQTPALRLPNSSNQALQEQLRSRAGSERALAPLKHAIDEWRGKGWRVAFVIGSAQRAERLHKLLLDYDLLAERPEIDGLAWCSHSERYPLAILNGQLTQGVQLPDAKLVLVAETEIFAERSHQRSSSSKRQVRRFLSTISQLKDGDHIVHADYGVGLYRGLKHQQIEGHAHDFLHLEYAEGSKLYVPIESIAKVQKFVGAEGQKARLDKLGSTRWTKTKAKVRSSVIELAGDLIKLYAARHSAPGWRFEPPGADDERFADGFPFDETPDQAKAIGDTLADMAEASPMDRLVCGDAGFGKTEVALRAAFKCTQHARQVAVLVPTTILAEQHFNTFRERFTGYPVKVGIVSRFHGAQQNRETLKRLAEGDLDIIVGTHRLLQSDVVFKDLGLAIIDEEHRFGVRHKERLKQMKRSVDVLTLTATPIPRTLHMALLEIKDISIISTPPHDRRSIRTYVATANDAIVRDAILRELQRQGQCFVLHNRINTIGATTARLAELVPEARFGFAHGQMDESVIEKTMLRFLNREIDVLVTTTIIESGLDIPNANTIIVFRADTFGLAQLYQIRGRVGRSNRQAFAYLLVPEQDKLTGEARERLRVLQALDDLGQGFNLATRDLEIRGAGNLLGKDQSGNVQSVGLELYNRILKEAVLHLKGEELDLAESIDPEIKFGIDAFIPEDYIPDVSERLVLYQRLAALITDQESQDLRAEILDRFGQLPDQVESLVELMRYRGLLRQFGVTKAENAQGRIVLSFSPAARIDYAKVRRLAQREPLIYRISGNSGLSFAYELRHPSDLSGLYSMTERLMREVN